MILNTIIIDDEPLALDLMESYVRKTPFLNLVGKYSSAVKATEALQDKDINLIFVDIQMPELNGLEFSKTVDPNTRIIFTTAFDQYAIDGYKVNALDYLLKPISYTDFLQSATKALQWFNDFGSKTDAAKDSIFVKTNYKLIKVEFSSILNIEDLKDYVKIHIENDNKPIISLTSLKNMEDILPEADFMRVHRSYIVNKNKIRIIDRGRIVFGKDYIPIGESYKQQFNSFIDDISI